VSIALPDGLTALEVSCPSLEDSNSLPVGAYIEEEVIGTANGVVNGLLGTLTVTKTGDTNGIVTGDFLPLGSSTFTVQAYLDGVFVAEATNVPESDVLATFDGLPSYDIELGVGVTVNFNGNKQSATLGDPVGPVICDQLVIIPEGVSFDGPFTAVEITASQVPALIIAGEIVSPMVLNVSQSGGILMLQWYGAGSLQSSSDLQNWSDMSGVTSPYVASMGAQAQFYRLVQTNGF
jgi:hypothetical protein